VTTTHLRPPEADQQQHRPHRRRTALIVAAATVVVAAFVVWLVAFSSAFGVRTVQVRGTQVLTAAQVRAAAALGSGTPLVRVDTAAVTRRVEQLPEVASAQVRTSFPSTVVITVNERQPVGYVRRAGQDVLVDRTGDQYRTVPKAPAHLPRFVVPAGTDSQTTGGAVAVVAAALPVAVRADVRSIEALDRQAITLVLTRGRTVAWGSPARSADKARVLPVLLARKHVAYVDVTNPDQPFTR
jgi:cell division protein FtsQ